MLIIAIRLLQLFHRLSHYQFATGIQDCPRTGKHVNIAIRLLQVEGAKVVICHGNGNVLSAQVTALLGTVETL